MGSRLIEYIVNAGSSTLHGFAYVKARLKERSTWIAFGAGVTVASALPSPWSYVSLTVAVIASMVPDVPSK